MTDAPTWQGFVPPIPASRLEPIAEDEAILMWVRSGTLTVEVSGATLVATAGRAVWLPPGLRHSARLDPGGVALPIITEVDDVPAALAHACVVTVPSSWDGWLLHRVASWFGFTSLARPDRSLLLELLAEVGPAETVSEAPALPPMPRSPGARSVVETLRRDPATSSSLVELAAAATTSPRTLQRQLSEETGHSLAQWRTAIRVRAAADHLARGRDLGWTAHHVGYASVSGFAHAFTERVGLSPGRYAAQRATSGRPLVHEHETLVTPPPEVPEPPVIPAAPAASWVTSFDSVLWVQRGSVRVEVAGRRWELTAGDVVWLPHGLAHLIEIAEESTVLPLGWRPAGTPARADSLHVVHMPDDPAMQLYLLHVVVANHFLLRPPGHDEQAFLDVVRPPVATVPDAMPAHLGVIVSAVVDDPSDRRSLAQWAAGLGADTAALRRDFTDVMGESFPRWRAKVRMTEAHALMGDGLPPSVVARRLGYSHLPAFSKAFTASHGIPPREWLRREAG